MIRWRVVVKAIDYEEKFYNCEIILYIDRSEINCFEFWYYDMDKDSIWFKSVDKKTYKIIDDEISYTQSYYQLWDDKEWAFSPKPSSIVGPILMKSIRFV